MAVITALKLKNFKSFRKAEIPFANGFTAIAGANASGKCVIGETRVLLSSGESVAIKELVENGLAIAKSKQFMEDGITGIVGDGDINVLSLNPKTMKVEQRGVSAVIRRLCPERLLRIRTRMGKEVTTTDYHPFFSVNEGGVYSIEAKDLRNGQHIAIPRQANFAKKTVFFSELLHSITDKEGLYVPFNEKYAELLDSYLKTTGNTLNGAAAEFKIPPVALRGLRTKQSINFSFLVKMLQAIGVEERLIADLVPMVKGKTARQATKMVWENSEEFSRLLGYAFAEGSTSNGILRMTTETPEMIEDIKRICKTVFGVEPKIYKYKDKAYDIILHSTPAYAIISKFGLQKGVNASTKHIEPVFMRHSNEKELAAFLDGYLSGDGYVSGGVVSVTTASKKLSEDIETIYLHLGIAASKRAVKKSIRKRGFSGNYYEINVSGSANLEQVTKKIRITNQKKMRRIAQAQNLRPHTNNDLIPNINGLIVDACKELKIRYARKKGPNIKLKSYADGACFPSRKGLQSVLDREFTGKWSEKTVLLESLANSDIFWDRIVSMEEVEEKPKYVYDLCVGFSHNFIANNVFVHNSNILDAILFGMGITSLRLLRASKLAELVNHDASEGYAKVELTIRDSKNAEMNVARLVDRQGKSIFKLDGKRKTLNEIQSLLLELGINPNGHNIVVQGDITRVIEMNAKQRRQVIEEVAGLAEFEEKKDEAMKKLEKVEQKVKDAHLILNEREAYLKALEEERGNALRYNSLQQEMKQSKATILSEEIKIVGKELEKARSEMERMRKDIEAKRHERDKLQEEERELEQKVEAATKQLIDASEKTYTTFGKDVEQKKGYLNLLSERARSKKEAADAKKERIAKLAEEAKGIRKTEGEKSEQLKLAKDEAQKASAQLAEMTRGLAAKSAKDGAKNAFAKDEARLEELLKEHAELAEKLHQVQILRHGLEKDAKSGQHALNELEAALKKLEEKEKSRKETLARVRELEKNSPAEKLSAKEKELERLLSQLHSFKGKLESLEESVKALAKAKAECPTCDKPLEAERKKALAEKKASEIGAVKSIIEGLKCENEKLGKEKEKLRTEERELSGLLHVLKSLHGVEEELAKTKEKIAEQREALSGKQLAKAGKDEQEFAKKLSIATKEKAGLEEKLGALMKGPRGREMNSFLQRMQELNERKNEKEMLVARLSMEIEQVLSNKTGAIASETSFLEQEISPLEKAAWEIEEEKSGEQKKLSAMEAELGKANRANRLLEEEKQRLTVKISNISAKREELSAKAEAREKELNELNLEQSRNDVRIVDLEEEFKDYANIEVLAQFSLNELKKRIPEIEKEIEGLGAINMKALEDFDAFRKEVDEVREKANKLDAERQAVVEMIQKIEVRKLSVFMECFSHVGKKFSELYFNFFEGEGLLDLGDKINPLEGGLLIQAKYKEDTLKSIDAMSGGEKSLTALAFLFAIQSFEPAPFYIFDEVDAALDKDNSIKVGRMIMEQSKKCQFIAISHNDAVINQADQIVGVALNKHKSSIIGLRLKKGEHAAQPALRQEQQEAEGI